jgi:hypothetical protein
VGGEQDDGVVAKVFGDALQGLTHPIGEEVDDRRVVVPVPDERERRAGPFRQHPLHTLDVPFDRHAGPVRGHDDPDCALDSVRGHPGHRIGDERRGVLHPDVRPDAHLEGRLEAGP